VPSGQPADGAVDAGAPVDAGADEGGAEDAGADDGGAEEGGAEEGGADDGGAEEGGADDEGGAEEGAFDDGADDDGADLVGGPDAEPEPDPEPGLVGWTGTEVSGVGARNVPDRDEAGLRYMLGGSEAGAEGGAPVPVAGSVPATGVVAGLPAAACGSR